jgi:cellulose synthase/poly-beta-1,6-N-acetylglucosamine synthase-like glycosyltransferase
MAAQMTCTSRRLEELRKRRLTPDERLPGISVFLLAHNEQSNIERVVEGFKAELPNLTDDYEIIVVDDGSSDHTGEIADRMASADHHVRVVHHPVNRGYGAAVISGINAANKTYVMLSDGDGQFDPADSALLATRMRNYDVVVGRRINRADPIMRRLNGKAWSVLMRLLFGLRVTDLDCGFKMFRREVLSNLELEAQGAMISTELMAKLAGRGARIGEVGVAHLPRIAGEQSGNRLEVIARAFKELIALYWKLRAARQDPAARVESHLKKGL